MEDNFAKQHSMATEEIRSLKGLLMMLPKQRKKICGLKLINWKKSMRIDYGFKLGLSLHPF